MISPALRQSKNLWSYNPLPKGCVLYVPLWNPNLKGSAFKSADPYGLACTVSGATYSNNGRTFDGADDYIEVAHNSNQLLTSGGSIGVWANAVSEGEGTNGRIIDKSTGEGGRDGFYFYVDTWDRYLFGINNTDPQVSGEVLLNTGFHFVVVTFDSDALVTFYVDGSASGVPGNTGAVATIVTTNAIRIGNRSLNTDFTFDGTIGECWIYNRVLSAGEVASLYHQTKYHYS